MFRQNKIKYQETEQTVNQELLHLQSYLNALSDGVCQGIVFVRLDGTIADLNERGARLLRVERPECLGRKFWSLFPDDLFGFSLKEALRFALAQKLIYKRVRECDLEITTSFFFEGAPSAHGLFLFLRDASEIQKLRDAAVRGERMKELGEMAARVAHEIRNPLGGIRGYASLLQRDLIDQKPLQQMAGYVIEGTKSLESLVSSILQYARPVKIEPRSVELGAFLKQIGRFVKVDPAYPPNVLLEIHIPQEPLLAPIDPDALQACLLNLIYNAFQAMELRRGVLTISLLKPHEYLCQIDVTDTGSGIEEEHLSQLFSPFFTTKLKGTGLGLVEAQKIVKAHGGQLEVRSQKGRGSTFTLTLPLKR